MKNINTILQNMSTDLEKNKACLIKNFGSLDYIDDKGNTLLHLIMRATKIYNMMIESIIKMLLDDGVDPNTKNGQGEIFIQVAMKNKYLNITKIKAILYLTNSYGLDINTMDNNGYTMMHTAMLNYNFLDIQTIWMLFSANGFDFGVKDNCNHDLINFVFLKTNYPLEGKRFIKELLLKEKTIKYHGANIRNGDNMDNNKEMAVLKFGRILTERIFEYEPAVGREKELKELFVSLAQEKKVPVLVGPSGVGKSSIADELAYLIQNNQVPKFLKDRQIFEVSLGNALAGTRYRGDFEENVKIICEYCLMNNTILFIDEIHNIYGAGVTDENKTNDMSSIIRNYIDRDGIKVIGITTLDEYKTYMANSAMKRRFDVIKVDEPKYEVLFKIVKDFFERMSLSREISLDKIDLLIDKIVDILIELTDKRHRVYMDPLCNPDLVISIIDKAFAYAMAFGDGDITIEHLIDSIESNNRIYDVAKENAINEMMNLSRDDVKKRELKKGNLVNLFDYKK